MTFSIVEANILRLCYYFIFLNVFSNICMSQYAFSFWWLLFEILIYTACIPNIIKTNFSYVQQGFSGEITLSLIMESNTELWLGMLIRVHQWQNVNLSDAKVAKIKFQSEVSKTCLIKQNYT